MPPTCHGADRDLQATAQSLAIDAMRRPRRHAHPLPGNAPTIWGAMDGNAFLCRPHHKLLAGGPMRPETGGVSMQSQDLQELRQLLLLAGGSCQGEPEILLTRTAEFAKRPCARADEGPLRNSRTIDCAPDRVGGDGPNIIQRGGKHICIKAGAASAREGLAT